MVKLSEIPVLALFLSVCCSFCPISSCSKGDGGHGAAMASRMEMPAIKSGDEIIEYSGFTVCYDTRRLIPDWVAYELTAQELEGDIPRSGTFSMDLSYGKRQAMREDYSNSGWDKGHMAPAADMKWSQTAMHESFYLTNICPQDHTLNSRDWQTLEKKCRDWAVRYGKIYIVCGPVIDCNRYGSIGRQEVTVPDSFFKAVLVKDGASYRSVAFIMGNDSENHPLRESATTVNEVESAIGYDLFTNLDDSVEEYVENSRDLTGWE